MYLDFIFELLFSRKELKKSFIGMTKKEKMIHLLFLLLEIAAVITMYIGDNYNRGEVDYELIGLLVFFCLVVVHLFVDRKIKKNVKKRAEI